MDFDDLIRFIFSLACVVIPVYFIDMMLDLGIYAFIGKNWRLLLACIVLIFVGCLIYSVKTAKHEREIAKENKAKRREELIVKANEALAGFEKYLTPCLIIDSNIWMNKDYKSFFILLREACIKRNYKLRLLGPQFDEISNIKKSSNKRKSSKRAASIAQDRIEEFQKDNLLKIENITIDAKRRAYADPVIVRLISSEANKGNKCTFISDDKELRIRVRQQLDDFDSTNWNIVEVGAIISQCKDFAHAFGSRLIHSTPPPQL